MAIGDFFKRGALTGAALGAAAVLLAPRIAEAASRSGRPFVKSAIKSGLHAYDRAREGLAELSEATEDIVAEARAEFAEESAARRETPKEPPSAGEPPGSPNGSQAPGAERDAG